MSADLVHDLARCLSIATRIEPALLRRARLRFVPEADASVEADLWFGSLVQSRTPLGIVFRSELLPGLRSELAAEPHLLDEAYEMVKRAHAHEATAIQLEEELTWLGLGGGGGTSEAARLLERAVYSMVTENREGLARWSARAFERLPATVQDLEQGRMLDLGSRARIGAKITTTEAAAAGEWLAWVAPAFPTLPANVRLFDGAVELALSPLDGAREIQVPQTQPPYVDVSWSAGHTGASTRVSLSSTPTTITTGTKSVRLATALGGFWELVPQSRRSTDQVLGLRGRIVTMDEGRTVLADGVVYIEGNQISAIRSVDEPLPEALAGVEVIDTHGTLYPGLIELHNHLRYAALPLWQVSRRFGNRQQWAVEPTYRRRVSQPLQILDSIPGIPAAIARFAEARCLAAGVTTSQGMKQQVQRPRLETAGLRIAEQSDDPELPSARTRIASLTGRDAATVARAMRGAGCFLLHLGEGTDRSAAAEFDFLRSGSEWNIEPSLAVIHGTALRPGDFEVLAKHGASLVWSPVHDLLLYGQTIDVKAARASGLRLGLGSSWPVAGSRNLLDELKWARAAAAVAGADISDRDLVDSVTGVAASILGWGRLVGSIVPGKRADLIVVANRMKDPYTALIDANESEIELVVVDGIGRVGTQDLMDRLSRGTESRPVGETRRVFDFARADPRAEGAVGLSLEVAEARLRDALRRLPELANSVRSGTNPDLTDEEGSAFVDTFGVPRQAPSKNPRILNDVEPMELPPLTMADEPDYRKLLESQPNMPREIGREVGLPQPAA